MVAICEEPWCLWTRLDLAGCDVGWHRLVVQELGGVQVFNFDSVCRKVLIGKAGFCMTCLLPVRKTCY